MSEQAGQTTDAAQSSFAGAQFTFQPTGATGAIPAFTGTPQKPDQTQEDSPEVQSRVEFLRTLQGKRDDVLKEYEAERLQLDLKYQKLMRPIYDKRSDVVAGRVDIKKNENGELAETEGFAGDAAAGKVRGVPGFWVKVLLSSKLVAQLVAEEDIPAIEHITDIKVTDFEDGQGFKLEFVFSSNPFFTNSVLTKEYFIPNLVKDEEPWLQKVNGTAIDWREGKNLTVTTKRVKPKGKKRGPPIVKTIPKESFFNFFSAVEIPDQAEADEDEYDEHLHRLELDYTLASMLRDKLVPDAVKYYLGEAEDSDDEEDEDDDDEFDEDDDDDEEGDDDDDDEDDAVVHKAKPKRGGRQKHDDDDDDTEEDVGAAGKGKAVGGNAAPGTGEQQQECKQS